MPHDVSLGGLFEKPNVWQALALAATWAVVASEPAHAQTRSQLAALDRAASDFLIAGYACQRLGYRGDVLDGNLYLNRTTRRAYIRAGIYGSRYSDHIQLIQRQAREGATQEVVQELGDRAETEYGGRLRSHQGWVSYNEAVQQAEIARRTTERDARYARGASWGGRRANANYQQALTNARTTYEGAVAAARARYGDAMAHSDGPILRADGQPYEGSAQTLWCDRELGGRLKDQLDLAALQIFRTFSYERRDLLDAMVELDELR